MVRILVAYTSYYGGTKKMAEAIAAGANGELKEVSEVKAIAEYDAIILGTPVHMGGPDWKVKKFIDEVCSQHWMDGAFTGKVAAVFASGGGFGKAGGGAELAMLTLLNNFAQLGMIIVPLPKTTPGFESGGLQWGPYGVSEELETEAALHHGKHVANLTKVLRGKKIFD